MLQAKLVTEDKRIRPLTTSAISVTYTELIEAIVEKKMATMGSLRPLSIFHQVSLS